MPGDALLPWCLPCCCAFVPTRPESAPTNRKLLQAWYCHASPQYAQALWGPLGPPLVLPTAQHGRKYGMTLERYNSRHPKVLAYCSLSLLYSAGDQRARAQLGASL